MKKLLTLSIISILALSLLMTGCNTQEGVDVDSAAFFSINIVSGESAYTFSKGELSKYTLHEFVTTTTKKDTIYEDCWMGVKLADILSKAGLKDAVQRIKCTASDGYKSNLTISEVSTYYIALFKKAEGKMTALPLDDIRIINSTDAFQTNWVKKLVKIEINPEVLASVSEFSITVQSGEKSFTITDNDVDSYELHQITTTTVKNDVETTSKWKGIKLNDILAKAGITATVTSLQFEDNGDPKYIVTYAQADFSSIDDFYIALYLEEEGVYNPLPSNEIKNVHIKDTAGKKWVKGLAKIILNPAA